ncbi:MAG: HD-GYP domain-containing protein [Thermoanaerobacteraceae bacterium]|nr:HD-GYP domain-containing protein [Thermoanaerobacteraceae bacterium]
MLTYFDNIEINLDLIESLSDFKKEFNINCLSILLVDNRKIYNVEEIYTVNNCQASLFLQNNTIVYLACDSLKPVYHLVEDDDIVAPLNKNFVEEVCIPINVEKHKDIIVCVYFGFSNKTKGIPELLSSFFSKLDLFKIYSYAFLKYNELSNTEKIAKLLILFEDTIKINQSSMRLHAFNVAFWTIEIAKKLNFPKDELEKLYYAALFHDIGKIRIKSSIINKESPLTEEEYEEVKRHVEYGYIITKELFDDIYPDIPLWVKYHHEMYDGSGYPNGLKGNDIPLPSRIIKVADVIDVLYSPRSYKQNVSVDKIIAELKRCSGKDFDPEVVDAALEVINERIILPMDMLKSSSEKILPANLSLQTYKDIFNFDGYFYSNEEQSYFKSTNAIKDIKDLWNLLSASLVVEILNSIYEYEVDVVPIDENTYLVSNIRSLESKSYVSILWELEAILITQDGKNINVKVKKLSADDLLFVCDNTYTFNMATLYKMRLQFEDGEVLILNGRITYSYPASADCVYYKYTFTNIIETTRDKLFRQIFRKQIELRRQFERILK